MNPGIRLVPIWLLAALPPLFWAGNFVLARALHMEITPISLSASSWPPSPSGGTHERP